MPALDAAESDDTRLGRLRDMLSDAAADARFHRELGGCDGRFGTADLDDVVATAEAPSRKVRSSSRRPSVRTSRRVTPRRDAGA